MKSLFEYAPGIMAIALSAVVQIWVWYEKARRARVLARKRDATLAE